MSEKPAPQGIDVDLLTAFLTEKIDGFTGPLTVEPFEAGQSNPTYRLTTPDKNYVLRRKPSGKLLPSAHAVDREYRVMTAVGSVGFPVPKTYVYADDFDGVDTPFFVMDFVPGRVMWKTDMPDLSPDERRNAFESILQTMAQLHTIEPDAVGLDTFGKKGNYFARQIGRWTKQYKASETENIPAMDRLIDWLPDNTPDTEETRVIHGDMGLHNLMFHPTEPKIAAVLDWELSTLGHPFADLTYNMMPWYMPKVDGDVMGSFQGLDYEAHGIPTFDAYISRYCALTGRDPITNPGFYMAFNTFRLAAIAQGIVARAMQGNASNPRAMEMKKYVAPLAELGWYHAQNSR